MISDTPNRKRLLIEQLATLRQMAGIYRDSRDPFVRLDLPAIQNHVSTLDALSRVLRQLNRDIAATTSSPGDRQLQCEILAARAEVNQLNRVFAALMRRSLRTVAVLRNVIQTATGTATSGPSFHAYV